MRLRSRKTAPRSRTARRVRTDRRKRLAEPVARVAGGAAATVLAARRALARLMRPFLRGGERSLRIVERQVTPARGLTVVALAAAVALGGSQFTDYRAVEVGAPEYATLAGATPAPEIEPRSPRSAHGAWVLAIGIATALVVTLAVGLNWRLARLLIFLGTAVVAISLAVDAPRGLREGAAAITYQEADAVLLGGFWAQLLSGATLIVVGPLLALQLRAERDARRARSRHRARSAGAPGSPAASPRGSGAEGATT
jgi:hypothetical protein